MILTTTYSEFFQENFVNLSAARKDYLYRRTLGYLFQVVTARDFMADLKKLGSYTPTELHVFKTNLLNNGYLIFNVKTYLYACIYRNAFDKASCTPLARKNGIKSLADARLIVLVTGSLRAKLQEFVALGYKSLCASTLMKHISSLCSNLSTYIHKFVYRKMAFIVRSHGIEFSDLISDLNAKVVQSTLLRYPRIETKLHLENLAKRSVHNYGINLIYRYTTRSRQRLTRADDGTFSANTFHYDAIVLNPEVASSEGMCCDMLGSCTFTSSATDSLDLRISVLDVLKTLDDKRRKFVHLLMYYDADFSKFLIGRGMIKDTETNEDLQERDNTFYISQALLFTNLSPKAGDKLIQNLRSVLA